MTQKANFTCGGFVLHKIPTMASATRLSAWFDKKGKLLDCEAINILGNSYKPSKADIVQCESYGRIHKEVSQ
jgi:hypothetical protein